MEFALRTKLQTFPSVALASRELDHDLPDGITKLSLKHDADRPAGVFEQRNNHDGTGMDYVFPACARSIGESDRVAKSVQQPTLEQLLAGDLLLDQMAIIHTNFFGGSARQAGYQVPSI